MILFVALIIQDNMAITISSQEKLYLLKNEHISLTRKKMEQNENSLPLKTRMNKVTACACFHLRGPHQRRKRLGDRGSGDKVTNWSWLPGSCVVLALKVPHPTVLQWSPSPGMRLGF